MRPRMLPLLAALALAQTPGVTSPAAAVTAAHRDASAAPKHDRVNYRYVFWPDGWDHTALLTRAQQSLLSDQGKFCRPVYCGAGTYRLDARESGWDLDKGKGKLTGLQVWEKFAPIDFAFHVKWEFRADASVTVYFPAGRYEGAWHKPSYAEVPVKAGQKIDRPAPWANPPVEIDKGVSAQGQDELRRLLYTEVPIVMAPWWLVLTSRQVDLNNRDSGVGYLEWFQIKNRADYFRVIGMDEDKAVRLQSEHKAIVEGSGIADAVRQMGLIKDGTGREFFTLDVFDQSGRGQPKRNLRRGELKHDAERRFGHLPNGLPLNGLFAADGTAQESAPDKVGANKSALNITNDPRIHAGGSCWDCHGISKDYIAPFEDWARAKFKDKSVTLSDPDDKVKRELESAYLRDIQWEAQRDRENYARAVAILTSTGPKDRGLTVAGFTRIYRGSGYYKYLAQDPSATPPHKGVTLAIAAAELGVTPEKLRQAIVKYNAGRGLGDMILTDFLDPPPGGSMRRLEFEDSFQAAAAMVYGFAMPEIVFKQEKKP